MTTELKKSILGFKEDFDKRIERYFEERIDIKNNDLLVGEALNKLKSYVLAGGKRLRPYLLHRINNEFRKQDGIEDVLLAFEFLHNSTLIDDDIIDEHNSRRNEFTLRYTRGEFESLLISNILRGYGINLIVDANLPEEFKKRCIDSYLEVGRSIDKGQILDLNYRRHLNLHEIDCISQTELVTATFLGHMFDLGGLDFEIGKNLGVAFQLSDDLMDVDKSKQKGRAIGSDIREGCVTLLSNYTYQKLSPENQRRFSSLFGRKDISNEDLQWMIDQYRNSGAIDYVKRKIEQYTECINKFPKDHWIVELGEYSLARTS